MDGIALVEYLHTKRLCFHFGLLKTYNFKFMWLQFDCFVVGKKERNKILRNNENYNSNDLHKL